MKTALWTVLGFAFTLATLGAIVNAIRAMAASNVGSQSAFGTLSGAGDAALYMAFIAVLALVTRGCFRRAVRAQGPGRRQDPDEPRRPWER